MRLSSKQSQLSEKNRYHKNFFFKILSWILLFTITLPLYGTGVPVTASEENGLCPHHPEHTEDCGYQPAVEGSPCTHQHDDTCGYIASTEGSCTHQHDESCGYVCPSPGHPCGFVCGICSGESSDSETVFTVTSWTWDSEYLTWEDASGLWGLGIPGASAENPVTREVLAGLLPGEITATLSDHTEQNLPLTWDLESFPEEGAYEGSYTLHAGLSKCYTLGEHVSPLSVILDLGEGALYADKAPWAFNNWSWEGYGKPDVSIVGLCIDDIHTNAELADVLEKRLPKRIYAKVWSANLSEFFTPDAHPAQGGSWGWLTISWADLKNQILNMTQDWHNDFRVYAAPPVDDTYDYIINDDSTPVNRMYQLPITIHPFSINGHTVPGLNPPNTTVNLFDYWVDTDGASGDDLLPKTDTHVNTSNPPDPVPRTGVTDWNKGINEGRLLLFGDGNIHAGFWNKGAGAGSGYGKAFAGMSGIVKPTLGDNGYPVINTDKMNSLLDNYMGISDWKLCGDHDPDKGTGHDSSDYKNISTTVSALWGASGNTESLDYLFSPDIGHENKRTYKNVENLFQIDSSGYYYYDMRQNFAQLNDTGKSFILYDAPAVDRTDEKYTNTGGTGDFHGGRSIGNFYPFNKGSEVFTGIDENGKLINDTSIQSNNQKGAFNANHHLGMTVDIDFRQPLGGMINVGSAGNTPMTFQFSGDDDVWIFIDDVLVLDLGGIHSEIYGTIDFSTGKVAIGQSWKTNGFPYKSDGTVDLNKLYTEAPPTVEKTLYELFDEAHMADATQWSTLTPATFASNTSHTLKMFYLERGNYDSSLALRFNLQPLLYQQVKKVDQDGRPISGVEFDLCPAKLATGTPSANAIRCLYTDSSVNGGKEFYVEPETESTLVHLTTSSDGSARFLDDKGNYFNFADRGKQYYILKETKTPPGYRTLPIDIVLYYDPDTSMLSVANRWTTGAYACSVAHVTGTGQLTYGEFDPMTGNTNSDPTLNVSTDDQSKGLVMAVPILLKKSSNTWEALYGSNLGGFQASDANSSADPAVFRNAVLGTMLSQAMDSSIPDWYLSWDEENRRLGGTLSDLPGLANRYQLNDANGDMRMVYGMVSPDALEALGIQESSAQARYEALGRYAREHGVENTLKAIIDTATVDTKTNTGFNFLNIDQFNRSTRSLIYIPNEQRELWVMKIDQNGIPRNGARFGLYNNPACTGSPVAQGTTATVNGQQGTLIFSPSADTSSGHAQIMWASYERTHYYLKELSAPSECTLNPTVVPVVVGTHSIYADAGTKQNGVSVMAGVGRLTQTMRQYAMGNDVDITLQDITATAQSQPSANTEVLNEKWQDVNLENSSIPRSMNLHFGMNAVVDYGLHDQDGGTLYKPFFVTDTGFIRARVQQNPDTSPYDNTNTGTNKDKLGDTDLTDLFSLLNIVVVTDQTSQDTNTGRLVVSKMLSGPHLTDADYAKNFEFTITLTDAGGNELPGEYYFYGTDKTGYISSGKTFPLHHDESITILGLPADTRYMVMETNATGWFVFPKNGKAEGEISRDKTFFAAFRNSKEEWPEIGSLIIHKTVAGAGDKGRDFTFTVTFTQADGSPLEGDFPYTGDKTGTISSGDSVTLHHDQHIMISDLPKGVLYTVEEEEAGQDEYTTSSLGENGTIEDGKIHGVAFTNTRGRTVPPNPDPDGDTPSGSHPPQGPEEKKISPESANTGDYLSLLALLGTISLSGAGTVLLGNKKFFRK